MFRNSIKEVDEPSLDGLEAAFLPRRDSLSRLHDALKNSAGRVRCRFFLAWTFETSYKNYQLTSFIFNYSIFVIIFLLNFILSSKMYLATFNHFMVRKLLPNNIFA